MGATGWASGWVSGTPSRARVGVTDQTKGSTGGTLQVLAVNSLIWCRSLRGWSRPQPERKCPGRGPLPPPLFGRRQNISWPLGKNRRRQFSPSERRDASADCRGGASDCPCRTASDIFTPFYKSQSWLAGPRCHLFIYSWRRRSINSQ